MTGSIQCLLCSSMLFWAHTSEMRVFDNDILLVIGHMFVRG